uniref:DapH/DapD/GlmU-related protein n=1 Tax=Cupriavidus taiwanensis TaxID=164546 RepID=UPI000E2E6EBE|nr:DapH/DapD/GlmU-related protein [Cupriavidus taiwanensis]
MSKIHPTAIVSDKAVIAKNVTIGPFSVIGEAHIGEGAIIHGHVSIENGVILGKGVEVFHGALIGKEPKGAGATARIPEFRRRIEIGDECSIGPNAVIFFDVTIGSRTLLGDGASIRENCRIGSFCIISRYVTINYDTIIGDRTKIMDNSHITGKAIVGNDVFISVMVGTTNDNLITAGFGDHIRGPVIEDRAVIGVGASLLPAVQIGTGAVVAAGSVVTKDVKPSTLVAGIPARFVKSV